MTQNMSTQQYNNSKRRCRNAGIVFFTTRIPSFVTYIIIGGIILSSTLSSFVHGATDMESNSFGYVANTDVGKFLKLAYDIRDMREANDDFALKQDIYENGKNVDGLSLQQLSFDAAMLFNNTPLHLIYSSSFDYLGQQLESDEIGNFDGKPVGHFSDTLVDDLFKLNIQYIEATGSLALNVVQTYWGKLWNVLQACQTNNVTAMNEALDIAVALYVGSAQSRNENNQGYMLYNLAENVGALFGQDTTESTINEKTLDIFLEIQVGIAEDMCASEDGYATMRVMVRSLYEYTNTFLMQWLLYHVQQYDSGSDFIELFSLALWPQIHMCNTTLGQTILDLTVSNDVTDDSVNDAIAALQQSFYCLGISCTSVGSNGIVQICNDDDGVLDPFISSSVYQPTTDVRDIRKLDQDIAAIHVFIQNDAIDVAADFYQYGWNSDSFSFRDIANNSLPWTPSDLFDTLTSYYTVPTSLDNTIMKLLDPISASNNNYYASLTTIQRMNAVSGLLSGIVTYLGIAGSMEASINSCGNSGKDSVIMRLYDSSVALFIGSIETLDNDGISLYSIQSLYCNDFSTCDNAPDDTLAAFRDNAASLQDYNCDDAFNVLEQTIKPALFITLLQGFLSNVMNIVTMSSTGDDVSVLEEAFGHTFAFSYAIQPFINKAYPASADAIKSNTPFTPESQGIINATKVFNAVRNAVRLMQHVDCSTIGAYKYDGVSYGLCPADPHLPDLVVNISSILPNKPAPTPVDSSALTPFPTPVPKIETTPHSDGLAWGRYTFIDEANANVFSEFTLDVKAMYYAESKEEADEAYSGTSERSITVGANNNVTVRSLQEFSTKAYQFMANDPIYNFFRVALFEDETFDDPTDGDGEDFWAFENAIERLAIGEENGNSPPLAAETVIVLGIWHMIANLLYEAGRNCMIQLDSPELIDFAVALWIGQEQSEGKYHSGWSIYYIAQEAAKNFGFPEQEAPVNENLMAEFNSAQEIASICSSNENASIMLRKKVDDILRNLSVPLVQSLLYHMSNNNFQYVELYALSIIPQGISCDLGAFSYLRDSLFQGYSKEASLDDELMDNLGKVLGCLRFECDDLISSSLENANQSESLTTIVDTLCDELDYRSSSFQLASYSIQSLNESVMELARLDLDILQTELFALAGEYNLAFDIFKNGRNSRKENGGYHTLLEFAYSPHHEGTEEMFDLSTKYFGNNLTAESTISAALRQDPETGNFTTYFNFTSASRRQRAEIVLRTLQSSITLRASADKLFEAINACHNDEDGVQLVDEAAALYIGSIEGPNEGGSEGNSGKMMYALAKEFCDEFNKCSNHIDAKANEIVLLVLDDFRDAIKSNECASAFSMLKETILGQMEVPLLQALLYHADVNEGLVGSSNIESIAGGAVLADSLLPLINSTNASSAEVIRDAMRFSVSNNSVLADKMIVFHAVRDALGGIGVDCNSVGTFVADSLSVCPANETDIVAVNTTTNLGNNLYTSSTYVQDRADIAKDIKEMEAALLDGRQDLAQLIYRDGKNSAIYDSAGKRVDLRTLSSFSTSASERMKNNPLYQLTVFALRDEKKLYGGFDALKYADTIVQESFRVGKDNKVALASEAAVALNLWMELTNELFETVRSCKNGRLTDEAGIQSIDEAAAYWIGDGQIAGNSEKGHLLYALAEEMGSHFGMSEIDQTRTNRNILALFHELKIYLSQSAACSDVDTARRVRYMVDKIVSKMVIVHVQALIHYLRKEDFDRVRIYAHAFVPLVVGCNQSTFEYLKAQLLDSQYRESELEKIVAAIRGTFPCLSLSCDDVGTHETENDDVCVDPGTLSPLAAYKPSTDVREYAQLDLDIIELDILLQMEAYEASDDLYSFGKHASIGAGGDGASLSLRSLATASGRSVVPQYASFKRYYANDEKYADTLVQRAFSSDSKLGVVQRRALVVGTSKYVILQMAALQSMYEAIGACIAGGTEREATASKSWDKAAAYMIGSLEGEAEAGSNNGKFFWQLSKQYCKEFNTCSPEVSGSAVNNDQIKTLLYAGRGAIVSGNCDELRKATRDLGSNLLVPLIQGTLSIASKLTSHETSTTEKTILQAEGFSLVQALLPLIQDGDRQAANIIASNFVLEGVSIADGRHAVVSALSSVLSDLGVDCADVGVSETANSCTGDSEDEKSIGAVVGIVLVSVALVGLALIFLRIRRRKNLQENKPEFLASNGEFNHNSDLLVTKGPEGSQRGRSDAETDCLNYADADETMMDDDDAYVNAISRALDERNEDQDEERETNVTPVV
jgi:Low iron-inducible periplasmic protein